MTAINCKGTLLSLEQPVVMGIINATVDSFYRGHLNLGDEELVFLAGQMIREGATILDIGGQSTRPGSDMIGPDVEMERVIPLVTSLHAKYPEVILSIDTFHAEVARQAVEAGCCMVNDVSAGRLDKAMLETVAGLRVPYICMHMLGTPATMQKNPQYDNVVTDVLDFFIERIDACTKAGITDVIIDPGFGFGKTIEHNFQLLKGMHAFAITGRPILAGLSRKSTISKTLGISAADALNGTTVLNTIALQQGASILRVHDVKEAKEAILLVEAYKKAP